MNRLNRYMGVNPKIMVPRNHPFVHRVFHEINHPFWDTPIFGNTHISNSSFFFMIMGDFPLNHNYWRKGSSTYMYI